MYAGDDVLLQYRHGDVSFKPYVKELFTADGLNVLLDSPPDHIHHRGLMFAIGVDGVSYWLEYAGALPSNVEQRPGKQVHQSFSDVAVTEADGLSWGRFTESLQWVSLRDNKPALVEQRRVAATRVPASGANLLTWECRLAPAPGKDSVSLTGSHYYGLGMRFIRSMDAVGEFRDADGKPGTIFRGEERLIRSNWCAYTVKVGGKDVTAAMFGYPDNPRGLTTWFTMAKPFAYLSATLALHEEPLKVEARKPLSLRYGVVLWDRPVSSEEIDALYSKWVAMVGKEAVRAKP
jgi:hypothetical protein